MAKRSSTRRSSSQRRTRKPTWQQWLLALMLVPLGVGLLLILGALTNVIVWGSRQKQGVMGGFYVLFSFVASNAIQKQWVLSAGWTLLGAAAWLALNRPEVWARVAAATLVGIGVGLITREFFRRWRRRPAKEKKRR